LIELSRRHDFVHWQAVGAIHRVGRAALPVTPLKVFRGSAGIKSTTGTGSVLGLPFIWQKKAEDYI